MNGWAEYEIGRQHREEIRHEVATARLEKLAHANREPKPYVVRDLSWELARYLDTEGFSASASATSYVRPWRPLKLLEEERVGS